MSVETGNEPVARKQEHDSFERLRQALETSAHIAQLVAQTHAEIGRQNFEALQDLRIAVEPSDGRTSQLADGIVLGPTGGAVGTANGLHLPEKIRSIGQSVELVNELTYCVSTEWLKFAHRQAVRNLRGFERLAACRTPQELAAAQSAYARDNLAGLLHGMRQIVEMSIRKVDETAQKAAELVGGGKAP